MIPAPRKARTLAVHPSGKGFGWVVFEGPFSPYDWGIVLAAGDKNRVCLTRLEEMLERFQPDTFVLEAFETRTTVRKERIARLCQGMLALAADRGLEARVYTRDDIRSCFKHLGARSRHEIAAAVARHVDALGHRLPTKRRAWQSEERRMPLFSAAALALTHYQFGALRLFDDLQNPVD